MSDNDLIRRGAALDILSEEGWLGDSLERINALPAVIVQEAQVNETPKSEHDASDVLSPAANGDA